MKYLVRIAGLFVVLFALYILVGEQLVGTSGSAFVNAELKSVRAPITGVVTLSALPPGARVQANAPLGSIAARSQTTPEFNQPNDALALERAELAALVRWAENAEALEFIDLDYEIVRRQSRIAALSEITETNRGRQPGATSAQLTSTAGGIIWSTPSDNGTFAVQGSEIVSIADCTTAFVHAAVDERLYNRLSVGDVAQFRFHNGPTLSATVSLLGGTGPRTLYETLAIEPTEELMDGYAVMLAVPNLSANLQCPLGQTGRVVFSEGPLSFLTNWQAGLP